MSNASAENKQDLVSVICRSSGRETLDQTLQSVVDQSHSSIELVLVDVAAKDLQAKVSSFPLQNCQIVSTGSPLGRSEAANNGMEAARGNWFVFLDDDDWISAEHIAGLLGALENDPHSKAAYSVTQKTDPSGNPIDYRFDSDFDPLLLMRDNFIPIHSMVFHRSLYEAGCRFDEQFDIYEDWDFWLQVSEHTSIIHVDAVTAFYRSGGDSETDISEVANRYRDDNNVGKARGQLLDKWMKRWTGSQLNALIGSLDKSELIASLAKDLQSEHDSNLQHQKQISELLKELESSKDALAKSRHQYDIAADKVEHQAAQILELQSRIDEFLSSTSWKLTKPVRAIGKLFKSSDSATESSEDQE